MLAMIRWIILVVVAVALLLLWKGLRTMWAESTAQVDALAPANERRTWPAPGAVGDRIMWCPILARKVVLVDTKIDEGEIGTVVGFTEDRRQPIISFDAHRHETDVVDKWAAARLLPAELARPRVKAAPPRRAKSKRRSKKRRR